MRTALLFILVIGCSGIVEHDAKPSDYDAAAPVEHCELCIDPVRNYCGESRCLSGAEYCAIYGCSPCAACGQLSCMTNVCGDPWY